MLGAVTAGAQAANAQAPDGQAGDASSVSGRVVIPGGDSVLAVPGARVTLHRVGSDHAGPLDSTRTDAAGRYTFQYRRTGEPDAIYFVSSSHGGIAYFTMPLHPGAERGDDAVITVFDTTSRRVPISVRGLHVIVQRAGADGTRRMTEVFDLSNDSSVTRVASGEDGAGAVWTALLPTGAAHPIVREGDIAAAAVRFADGHALVYAPFAPGIKQLAFTYMLPSGSFPVALPVQRPTQVLEVLLEEPGARVRAPGLRVVQPAAIQGREFQRFLATDVPASAVVTVSVPEMPRSIGTWFVAGLTLVIGGAMTWALARALRRR